MADKKGSQESSRDTMEMTTTEIIPMIVTITFIIFIIVPYYLLFKTGTFHAIWGAFSLLLHQQPYAVCVFLIILVALILYPLLSPSQKYYYSNVKEAVGQNTNIIIKIEFIIIKIGYFLFLLFILLFIISFLSFSLGLLIEMVKSVSTIPKPSYCQGLIYGNGSASANLYMTTKSGENLSTGAAILGFYSSLTALTMFTTGIGIFTVLIFLIFWPLTLTLSNSTDFACYGEAPEGIKGLLRFSLYIIGLFGITFVLSYSSILFALLTYFMSPYSQFVALYLTIAAVLLTFITELSLRRYRSTYNRNLWDTLYSGLFYVSIFSLLAFIAMASSTQYLLCLPGFSSRSFEILLTLASIVGAIPFAYTLSAAYNYYLCQLAKYKDKGPLFLTLLLIIAVLMVMSFLFLLQK
jgi:hypothetical protein